MERRGHREQLWHLGGRHELRRAIAARPHAGRRRRRAAGRGANDGGGLRRCPRGGRGSPFYQAKLTWFERLARWLDASADPKSAFVIGGDFNVAPTDEDVWDPEACHGGTHVSPPEREAFGRLCAWGLVDAYRLHHRESGRYTWWDYRAGNFHKNFGMRIDHLLVTASLVKRTVSAEIDREARKGKPVPSDHAPLVIDLDEPGFAFDPGWAGAEGRIAARRSP